MMRRSPPGHQPWQVNSLRTRFLLAILLWVALGIGGIWYSATRLFAKHVEEQYHEELDVHIRELAGLVQVRPDGRLHMIRPLSDPRYQLPRSGFYWQVSVDGANRLHSASMVQGQLDEEIAHSREILHMEERGPTGPALTFGFTRALPNGKVIHYVIATDRRLLDDTIDSFTRELTLWLLALAASLLATGMAIITYGLRPLDRLAEAIFRLHGGGSTRLEGEYPAEIAPLVNDLNAYISHNNAIVERARVQSGNLAHSLRTPLAIITDEAELMALRGGRLNDEHGSSAVFLEQARAMGQQIDYQLARASAGARAPVPGTQCRIGDVLDPILSAMRRLHPDKRFTMANRLGDDLSLPVDANDLSELLSNLLDNAGKWARHAVTVTLETGANGRQIRIEDDGPGIAASQLAEAFEIGSRLDTSQPGSGLGLAIARDIATSCRLALTLGNRADGAPGLSARIHPA